MIEMMTAYTEEVDEVDDAINEIMGQIDLKMLKKNSVGLITCHFDFTDTGFIGELCRKLPFDIIGMTTIASANRHGCSMYALALTVLTSDEVSFETAITGPLAQGDCREKLDSAYSLAAQKLPGQPSLILTFFPYPWNISGTLMLQVFDDVCGGVPFWGSIATETDGSYKHCAVFRNGDVSKDGIVMVLLHGPVDPEFIVVSIPAQNIRKDRGRITSSDGCVLKEINGISAIKYLKNLGVIIMKDTSIITPLMVFYEGNSVPIATAIYGVNNDGSLLCGGEMTEGASVAVGEITAEGIMASAGEGMNRMLGCGKKNAALMLPCISRYIMLSPNRNSELELISSHLENGKVMPYMLGYSGGEFCPVRDEAGILRNRFHGYTFSACIL